MFIGNIGNEILTLSERLTNLTSKTTNRKNNILRTPSQSESQNSTLSTYPIVKSLCNKKGLDVYKSVQSYGQFSTVKKTQTLDEIKIEFANFLNALETDPDKYCSHMAVKISDRKLQELASDPEKKAIVYESIKILFCNGGGSVTPTQLIFDADKGEYGSGMATGDSEFLLEGEELRKYEESVKGCFWRRTPSTEMRIVIQNNKAMTVDSKYVIESNAIDIKLSNIDINRIILGNQNYLKTDPDTGKTMRVIDIGLSEEISAKSLMTPVKA